jgi:hypothetical protein
MQTRRGIYYNLEESPYITKFKDFKFYFSSQFYRNKFEILLIDYINAESEKLYKRFKIDIDFSDILSFNLYRKIEKRGCYCIYYNSSINNYVITDKLSGYIQIKG